MKTVYQAMYTIYNIIKSDIRIAEPKTITLSIVDSQTKKVKWYKVVRATAYVTKRQALEYLKIKEFNNVNENFKDIKGVVHETLKHLVVKEKE